MLCINFRNRTKESGVLVDGGNRQESGFHLTSVTATPQKKKKKSAPRQKHTVQM